MVPFIFRTASTKPEVANSKPTQTKEVSKEVSLKDIMSVELTAAQIRQKQLEMDRKVLMEKKQNPQPKKCWSNIVSVDAQSLQDFTTKKTIDLDRSLTEIQEEEQGKLLEQARR